MTTGRVPEDKVDDPGSSPNEAAEHSELVLVPLHLIEELSMGRGQRSLGQELFDRDDMVMDLLDVTDQEKAVIQSSWSTVLEDVRATEAELSKAEDLADETVRITVPSLSGRIESMGDRFESKVKEVLGENRGDVFLAMKQVGRAFTPEEGATTYDVKVESVGDGRWRYHMTQQGPSGRKVWVSEKVPDQIRHLTDAAKIFPEVEGAEEVVDDCG